MKAIGQWVVLEKEELVSASGIISVNDNIARVHSCAINDKLEGKRVIYNAEANHFTYNDYIVLDYKAIMATTGDD
tara:strand:- start:10803 stop:11027 length:225 start_codon:yes stop_codon:yes gene_type:complete